MFSLKDPLVELPELSITSLSVDVIAPYIVNDRLKDGLSESATTLEEAGFTEEDFNSFVEENVANNVKYVKEQLNQFINGYIEKIVSAFDMIKDFSTDMSEFVSNITAAQLLPPTIVTPPSTGAPNPGWNILEIKNKISLALNLLKSVQSAISTLKEACNAICIGFLLEMPPVSTIIDGIDTVAGLLGGVVGKVQGKIDEVKQTFEEAEKTLDRAKKNAENTEKAYNANKTDELKKKLDKANAALEKAQSEYSDAKAGVDSLSPKDENKTM